MRAVVQRVSGCEVRTADRTPAARPGADSEAAPGAGAGKPEFRVSIGPGLLVYVAVAEHDDEGDLAYLADKIGGLRVFPDGVGRMHRSVLEQGGEVLVVSQFTLYGDVRRGRRPSFDRAAPPARAKALYEELLERLRARGLRVSGGKFQAHMLVAAVNDGPVTILLDSARTF
jgi:D-tyrosyl-tRNA(Tyr) deacylase